MPKKIVLQGVKKPRKTRLFENYQILALDEIIICAILLRQRNGVEAFKKAHPAK
jgi:hypothetical protein